MQIFIKTPNPYNKSFIFDIDENMTFGNIRNMINNKTCYSKVKYYLYTGTIIINESMNDTTIKEFNEKNPRNIIDKDITLHLRIRRYQSN